MNEESMRDGTNRGETNRGEESFSASLKWQAGKNETIARNLSREAMAQWQKAINGVLAMPAALALTAAANSIFNRGFHRAWLRGVPVLGGFDATREGSSTARVLGRSDGARTPNACARSATRQWESGRQPEPQRADPQLTGG